MNTDFHRFFCCYCFRQNQIADLTFTDPSHAFIYFGIKALKVSKRLIIADFGSSYGQNSIRTMKIILDYLDKCHKLRESPLIIHNDIPTNNWSKFFQILADQHSYYSLANGRSFYEQCLPTNSLSIGYSSASLHYLSKKPCNILNHCYIHFGNDLERELFRKQAKEDWNLFLENRSRELQTGGILILNIPSVKKKEEMGFNRYFDWIYQCAGLFLTEELVEFTLPFYLRSLEECVDLELFHRCSLELIKVEFVRLKSIICDQPREHFAKSLVMLMQSGTESVLKQTLHRRPNEEIDRISKQFWSLFEEKIQNDSSQDDIYTYATYLILKKK